MSPWDSIGQGASSAAPEDEQPQLPGDEFDPVAYILRPLWQKSSLGLERIQALLAAMGDPQERLRFVHVAGTNGKGSVCAYLCSILRMAGLRCGSLTSPYIYEIYEQIRIDGRPITHNQLAEVTAFVRDCAEPVASATGEHPTEFELMAAVAFEYFARQECDIVVCEVGLGGRLDATNAIAHPEVCVITALGMDHTDLLGNTLPAIAGEKAAIVKPGATVVAWPEADAAAAGVIAQAAKDTGDELRIPDFEELSLEPVDDTLVRRFIYKGELYRTRLLGSYQPANGALAIEVAWALRDRGWEISQSAVVDGIAEARWPGRFDLYFIEAKGDDPDDPTSEPSKVPFVVDGGHNAQGARALADSLEDIFPGRNCVFILGVLADKDYRPMIRAVEPLARAFVCVDVPNARNLDAPDLAQAISETAPAVPVSVAGGFSDAIACALALAEESDILCAFGSLYSLGAIQDALDRFL